MPFDEYYNRALDYAVSTKLVDQAAAKAKITETKEYKKQLEIAKKELAKKVYIESQVDKNISDADLNKLYDEYKGSFKPEKEIKAKHILVDNEATANNIPKTLPIWVILPKARWYPNFPKPRLS